jgi:hypothetical protein
MIKKISWLLLAVFCLSALYFATYARIARVISATKSMFTTEAARVVKGEKTKEKIVKKMAPKAAKHLTVSSPAAKQPKAKMPVMAPASSLAPAGGPQQPVTPGPAPSSMGH